MKPAAQAKFPTDIPCRLEFFCVCGLGQRSEIAAKAARFFEKIPEKHYHYIPVKYDNTDIKNEHFRYPPPENFVL